MRRNQNNAHTRSGRPARSIRGIQGRKTGRRRRCIRKVRT
nr:MAG TPA: hypothetical protein [Caudoviricetes sp.]